MKKLFLLSILLLLMNCTSRKINRLKFENYETYNESEIITKEIRDASNNVEIKNEISELKNIISTLNINYSGKNIDDKLDVLLKQSHEGTKLTISGTGTANFNESTQSHIKTLQKQIINHYDSLHAEQIQEIKSLKTEINQEITSKEKQTKSRGFILWVLLCALIVIFTAFKLYLKSVLKVFK